MRQSRLWVKPLNPRTLSANLLAGMTVSVVALPLALGFGIASGMGASAGLISAVIAGVVAAAFGGSRFQVSGPTGAMTAVLVPIAHQYGIDSILLVGFLAGLMLIFAALARLGNLIHRLPDSLVEGLTAGIALVIALQQVSFILGVKTIEAERIWQSVGLEIQEFSKGPNLANLGIALAVFGINLFGSKLLPRLPLALLSVVLATVITTTTGIALPVIGELPRINFTPSLRFFESGQLLILLAPAFSVALLAALESLLSAKIADRMKSDGADHEPNRELFGQGLANIVTPLFGGVPATAALARTAVNVRAGATNPSAAIFHALILGGFVMFAGNWLEIIPLAALGGVLLATAWKMIRPNDLAQLFLTSKTDAAILTSTMLIAVLVDLVAAVFVGLALALVLKFWDRAKERRDRSR